MTNTLTIDVDMYVYQVSILRHEDEKSIMSQHALNAMYVQLAAQQRSK